MVLPSKKHRMANSSIRTFIRAVFIPNSIVSGQGDVERSPGRGMFFSVTEAKADS
jgi:hypothetical protein